MRIVLRMDLPFGPTPRAQAVVTRASHVTASPFTPLIASPRSRHSCWRCVRPAWRLCAAEPRSTSAPWRARSAAGRCWPAALPARLCCWPSARAAAAPGRLAGTQRNNAPGVSTNVHAHRWWLGSLVCQPVAEVFGSHEPLRAHRHETAPLGVAPACAQPQAIRPACVLASPTCERCCDKADRLPLVAAAGHARVDELAQLGLHAHLGHLGRQARQLLRREQPPVRQQQLGGAPRDICALRHSGAYGAGVP